MREQSKGMGSQQQSPAATGHEGLQSSQALGHAHRYVCAKGRDGRWHQCVHRNGYWYVGVGWPSWGRAISVLDWETGTGSSISEPTCWTPDRLLSVQAAPANSFGFVLSG